MVDFIKNWMLNIVTLVLFFLLVEIMLPTGNTRKIVNLVAGFILLIAIIRPVTHVLGNDIKLSETYHSDSSFLDRTEIMERSDELEEKQMEQVVELYRTKLISRIEAEACRIEGVNGALADVIINEDYESGEFGHVKRVYLELMTGRAEDIQTIEVERINTKDAGPTATPHAFPVLISEAKNRMSRITDVNKDDVVVSVRQ